MYKLPATHVGFVRSARAPPSLPLASAKHPPDKSQALIDELCRIAIFDRHGLRKANFAGSSTRGRVTHDACVTDAPTPDGQSGLPWCATSVDPSTGDLLSTYGICRNSDISEAGPCTGHDGRRHPIVLSNGVAQNGYVMQGGWSYYSLEVATDAETLASGHGLTVRVTVDTPDLVEDVDMYV